MSPEYLILAGNRQFLRDGLTARLDQHEGRAVLLLGTKAAEPRDDAERNLMEAMADLFRELLPLVAARLERGEMPPDDILTDAFTRVLRPALVEVAADEFLRQGVQVGVQFDSAIVNQQMVDWAQGYTFDLVTKLTETTRKTLQQAIQQFASTPGMTRGQLEALILPAFGPVRAEMIAVTEVTRAAQAGVDAYQTELATAGVPSERIYRTSADEKVCPVCAPSNGKPESEWEGRGPPPRHVKCRCFCTLRVKRETP